VLEHFDVVDFFGVVPVSVHPAVDYAFGATRGAAQGGSPSGLPAPLVVRAMLPRDSEVRRAGVAALTVVSGGSRSESRSSDGCWWSTSDPSQARTTHAAFGSLKGSRRLVRRARQLGASGRDGDVTGRYIVAGLKIEFLR